jgi:hypothetical protein
VRVSDVKLGGRVLHDHDEEIFMGEDLPIAEELQERDPDLSSSFSVDPRETPELDMLFPRKDGVPGAERDSGVVLEDDIGLGGLHIQHVAA